MGSELRNLLVLLAMVAFGCDKLMLYFKFEFDGSKLLAVVELAVGAGGSVFVDVDVVDCID